jgi:hypothetical protein
VARDPARERDLRLQRLYGITVAQYDEILAHQGGGCAVCGIKPAPGKNLNVDHDHKTGLLRGLLCWRCNRRVVADHRDPDGTFLLRQAAQYLELPPAVDVVGEVFGRKGRITNKRRRRKKKAA